MEGTEAWDFDPNSITIAEMEEIEDATGKTFDQLFTKSGGLGAKALRAFIYVLGKRKDPTFTMEDAGKVKVSQLAGDGDTSPLPEEPPKAESNGSSGSSVSPNQAVSL